MLTNIYSPSLQLFIQPLLTDDPPHIPRDRVEHWVSQVFSNFADVHLHHRRMLDRLHEIQREEHPLIRSISAPVFDAALNWRDAYMIYIPHYPIAEYMVDEEKANNKEFKAFVEVRVTHVYSRAEGLIDWATFVETNPRA